MRITFVIPPPNLSGGLRVVSIYAERLRRRGHDVLVVAPPNRRPTPREALRSLYRGRGWPFGPRVWPSHFGGTGVECRILDRHRPVRAADLPDADVVVATWWETAEWVADLPPAKGAKVHFVQGYEVFDHLPIDRVEAVYRLPIHRIVISGRLAGVMRDRYGDDRATLIRNSVDHEQFHAPPRGKAAAPTVGLLYATPTVKGCDVSLRALELCAGRVPNLRLVAFGGEPIDPRMPLPPGARYTMRPAQDRLRDHYAACDVWLCGSRSEGFHLPPLEAMACRCPVVSTRVGGPLDVIEEGVNGHLVDVEDAEALADRLARVLGLPEADWRRMSDAALATATGYTWDDATDRFEEALRAASGGRRGLEVRAT